MSSGDTTDNGRDEKGRFGKGNPGGPGRRPRSSPLHKAISDEKAIGLWEARLAVAEGEPEVRYTEAGSYKDYSRIDGAAEFILKYKNGTPYQSAPDIPEMEWPRIACVADLAGLVHAVLGAQTAGLLDGAGFGFCIDLIGKLAKTFEIVELGPEVARIKERLDEREAVGA
jgi:hypothetical protein